MNTLWKVTWILLSLALGGCTSLGSSWSVKESEEMAEGVLVIRESSLKDCKPGAYDVTGRIFGSPTSIEVTAAKEISVCFENGTDLKIETEGLKDGDVWKTFESAPGPDGSQISGQIERIKSSFALTMEARRQTRRLYRGQLFLHASSAVPKTGLTEKSLVGRDSQLIADGLKDLRNVERAKPPLVPNPHFLSVVSDELVLHFHRTATIRDLRRALRAFGAAAVGISQHFSGVRLRLPTEISADELEAATRVAHAFLSVKTVLPVPAPTAWYYDRFAALKREAATSGT